MNMRKLIYIGIAIFTYALPAHAAGDAQCISEQLQQHQKAEQQLLHSFAIGDSTQLEDAALAIATRETYLQSCGLSGDDPRLLGQLAGKDVTIPAFAAAVLGKRLHQLTQFQPDPAKSFAGVNWGSVEGVMP